MLTKWENCDKNLPIQLNVDVKQVSGNANKIVYSGAIEISREIRGPLEVWLEINRCDLEMKKCEKAQTQKFAGICQKLRDKRSFYYSAANTIHPQLSCPFKAQNYTATNSSVDVTAISFLPLSDCLWMTTSKVYAGEGKEKEVVMCTLLESKIVKVKSRRKN